MGRRLGAVLFVGAAVAASLTGVPAAGAATELRIEPGFGGFAIAGRAFPTAVEVDSDRLFRGRIELTARVANGPASSSSVRLPVEVPGGGAKRFVLITPSTPGFPGATIEVQANLIGGDDSDDDKVVARSGSVILKAVDDRELVGLLPGARRDGETPETAPLAIDAGVAQFFPIGATELALGPTALESLGTIAGAGGEVAALPENHRRALLEWLRRGGTLLVDGAPGATVDGLPDAWQPGPDGIGAAERGRVRMTAGAMAAGRWDGLVFPTPSQAVIDPRFGGFQGPRSLGDSLAGDAGLRVPQLGWLLAFLLIYTLVVGPIFGFALNRRGQAEWAWIAIPLAAVLFTSGSYAAARGLRSNTRLAHGSVVELSPAGPVRTTYVGVAARNRQSTRLAFEQTTWSASRVNSSFGDSPGSDVELTDAGPAARLELAGGQFAVAGLVGPDTSRGALAIEAVSEDDDEIRGTVRNGLGVALEEVIVVSGGRGVRLGSLAPGEEREWRAGDIGGGERFGNPFGAPELQLWQVNEFQVRPTAGTPVNAAVWQAAQSGRGASSSGEARVIGWTDDVEVSIDVSGSPTAARGKTAITASSPVRPSGRITNMTVRGEFLRSGFEAFGGRAPGGGGGVVRFLLPAGAVPSRPLVATLPAGSSPEFWVGDRWIEVGGNQNPLGGAGRGAIDPRGFPMPQVGLPTTDAPVPPGALVAGQVFVRLGQEALVNGFRGNQMGIDTLLRLREEA